jgi:hypothetical protein
MLPKCQVDKMSSWQIDKFVTLTSWQSDKLTWHQTDKMAIRWNSKLTKCFTSGSLLSIYRWNSNPDKEAAKKKRVFSWRFRHFSSKSLVDMHHKTFYSCIIEQVASNKIKFNTEAGNTKVGSITVQLTSCLD